jgi:hypothetical protein
MKSYDNRDKELHDKFSPPISSTPQPQTDVLHQFQDKFFRKSIFQWSESASSHEFQCPVNRKYFNNQK